MLQLIQTAAIFLNNRNKKRFLRKAFFFFGDFMSFSSFINLTFSDFSVFLTVAITLAVAFVNGWTDAPNAIASSVATRCLSLRKAVILAAACDFAGSLTMGVLSSKVTQTVVSLASFGSDSAYASAALCASMSAVVIWATAAWAFGIPTSESHALIAGLMGAGVAVNGGFSGVDSSEWIKVAYGLILSTLLGFVSGFVFSKATVKLFADFDKTKSNLFFKRSQIAASSLMAFMHGAQDSQKFTGILVLVISLADSQKDIDKVPAWMLLLCSFAIALGTATGGARIIKSVGMDMIRLRRDQGFAADMAGAFCLLLSTVFGLPVSTTHTKTSAVLGVGTARSARSVDWSVAGEMGAAWILTFPGCALLSCIITLIYMRVF